ncbi:MAG TPA: protein kinase [Polyangia bacterium]|nr:protein kinase [Polyangia bacterium]
MTASAPFPSSARFQVRGIVGEGSMGTVYRALDQETGREVALKSLREPGATALYHLKAEFRSLRDIAHPNLVELYDLVVDGGQAFFTMELVDGTSFLDHVGGATNSAGAPSGPGAGMLARLGRAMTQLKGGMATLHAAGKLHRDIKPSNILVTPAARVVLLDFGLATSWSAQPGEGEHGELAGSLPYMAPEQIWGMPLLPSADWYSVGVLLYEALTGKLPFPESPPDMLASKQRLDLRAPADVGADVPAWLWELIVALLDPDPERRPGADDIEQAFLAAGADGMPRPRADGFSAPAPAPGPGAVFVGRDRELGELRAAHAALLPGTPTLVCVSGPSGLGKTELCHQFQSGLLERQEGLIFATRCHPQESVSFNAFDGIVDQLSQHVLALPPAQAAALEPPSSVALARLFPVMDRVPGWRKADAEIDAMEPRLVRARALAALRALVDALGAETPVTLWIDDQQWSDADSLVLLDELLQPGTGGRLLVLLTFRTDSAGGNRWLASTPAALNARIQRQEIVCQPLGDSEARELARRIVASSADAAGPEQIDTIVTESAGSPFFIGQLANHATAASTLAAAGSAGSALLSQVIKNRIDHLTDTERRIVEIVAIAGGPVERTLALRAAGVGEAGRPDVARLARQHLIKTAERAGARFLESYHDRIRESVSANLDGDSLRARHLAMAEALESVRSPDAEALCRHWLAAGDRARAAIHGAHAADKAAAALAFGQAAELYGRAATLLDDDPAAAARCRARQADALVNAGRCAEAAPLFLTAADQLPADAADLRRRAAESYLVSGHIDQGVAVLARTLPPVGVTFPATPRAALLAVLRGLLWIRFRGLRFRERPASEVDARARLRVDMCLSASKGLLLVDSLRGAAFAFQSLRHAFAAGDPERVGESLVLVGGGVLAPAGGWMERLGARMLARAAEIAGRTQNPRLAGMTQTMTGQTLTFAGLWRQALASCDAGVAALTARCRGVAWETNVGYMGALRAVEELGRLHDYRRRCQQLCSDADARGDVYARVTAVLYEALANLAAGRPPLARQQAAASLAVWTKSAFSVQHLYTVRLEAFCDIYEDRAADAWRRIEAMWPALGRSGLLRIPIVRIDAHALRARAALAMAQASASPAPWLELAARDRRRLAREKRPDTPGHALLLEAGEAGGAGRARALACLDQAIAVYAANGMSLWQAYAQHRKGELLGGDDGRALADGAARAMRGEGIAHPARWLAVVAPGRWDQPPS